MSVSAQPDAVETAISVAIGGVVKTSHYDPGTKTLILEDVQLTMISLVFGLPEEHWGRLDSAAIAAVTSAGRT